MSATARIRLDCEPRRAARLSNVELVRACGLQNSSDVWEEFVGRFNRFVCVAVVRALSQCSGRQPGQLEPEAVADLVQDTYVKLLERSAEGFGTFRGANDAAVFVYIGRVAISVVVDAQRRNLARKRGRDILSLDAVVSRDDDEEFTLGAALRSPEPSPEQHATAAVMRCEVADVLGRVVRGRNADRDLRIAEAYILDGLPLNEIAESVQGVGAGAMKSSVRRTGARLRSEMARREKLATLRQVQLS